MQLKRRKCELSANSRLVLEKRYLLKDEFGKIIESPEGLFARVANAVASVEPQKKSRESWAEKFFEMMAELRFLPNSPTLMNAGKPGGQLSACFVLPIEDSLDSIFDSLKAAARIHQSGGGTGFAFSNLRPKGSAVRSTSGIASGPVSFMKIYDVATETIKQGGTRRGANMAILRVDHPDILEFIASKASQTVLTNFNISVGISNRFMSALASGSDYELIDHKGQCTKKMSAKVVFESLVQSAWKCGDPGVVFLDRINFFNPTPKIGRMISTNPCGEQPLLPFESCNLGSLNLNAYWMKQSFDWDLFASDIESAVRFLDNVIDVNVYPVVECEKITLRNRKIGLGTMGFADLLLEAGLRYDSVEARDFGEKIMGFLDRKAKQASATLAKKRGAFPNWKGSLWQKLGYPPLRNATVSTIAPTGTISVIAGVSSGIEPLFSGVFYRNVLDGERLVEVHPAVKKILDRKKIRVESLSEEIIAKELGSIWSPSKDVSVEGHISMQAAFQRHSDSAVSKTINLKASASVEDVSRAYLMAYSKGCKGITVYRDQSRQTQVLEHQETFRISKEDCPTC